MATVAISIAVTFLAIFFIKWTLGYLKNLKFSFQYSAPAFPFPILGHSYLFFDVNREDILETLIALMKGHSRRIGTVIGGNKIIWYYHPENVEEVLSSNEIISKSGEYDYLVVS